MNDHQHSWQKLVAAARLHREQHDDAVPYGFAVRVAGRAFDSPPVGFGGLLEKFALRGLIAACTFSLAAMAFSYVGGAGERDEDVASTDVVGEILDLT